MLAANNRTHGQSLMLTAPSLFSWTRRRERASDDFSGPATGSRETVWQGRPCYGESASSTTTARCTSSGWRGRKKRSRSVFPESWLRRLWCRAPSLFSLAVWSADESSWVTMEVGGLRSTSVILLYRPLGVTAKLAAGSCTRCARSPTAIPGGSGLTQRSTSCSRTPPSAAAHPALSRGCAQSRSAGHQPVPYRRLCRPDACSPDC
jgi:hypothetical protein